MKTEYICVDCDNEIKDFYDIGQEKVCDGCKKLRNRVFKPDGYLKSIGVGERHWNCRFDNYNGVEGDKLKKIVADGLVENVIISSQNTGNGKTHLAVSILSDYGHINSKKHFFVNFSNLMLGIRNSFDNPYENEKDIIEKYSRYQMLVIDDIGAEKATEYTTQVLYIILNNRYEAMKPTITTTNMNGVDIEKIYGKRILSRLRSGHLITLALSDQRGIK